MKVEKTDYGWCRRGRISLFRAWIAGAGRITLGQWGEWTALRHVLDLGWDVLVRNWHGYGGELDLIAFDGPFLTFLEVKTRTLPSLVKPEEQVGVEKERRLEDLAMEFCFRYELSNPQLRFDLVAVETPDRRRFELRHYRAFM